MTELFRIGINSEAVVTSGQVVDFGKLDRLDFEAGAMFGLVVGDAGFMELPLPVGQYDQKAAVALADALRAFLRLPFLQIQFVAPEQSFGAQSGGKNVLEIASHVKRLPE